MAKSLNIFKNIKMMKYSRESIYVLYTKSKQHYVLPKIGQVDKYSWLPAGKLSHPLTHLSLATRHARMIRNII